jgi:biopolymer transport protein ExbD
MAMSSSNSTEEAVPYINVTPLIDVLLVMLIIFMVVSPLKPTKFEAKIPSEPDPNQDLSQVKPNPLTLVVTVGSDSKIQLNKQDMGAVEDASKLGTTLSDTFKERAATGQGFKPGTTEVEKTVFVKAPRAVKYGDVVKVIDVIKGAGAEPIGLQIDDLEDK